MIHSQGKAQLSPGELNAAHESLEGLKNCEKCHEAGKQITGQRCLECHILLRERISKGLGMHGGPGYEDCVKCHVEHLGREGELIWWKDGQEKFDHAKTGYTLAGKHSGLDCRKCHNEKNIHDAAPLTAAGKKLDRTYLGLTSNCLNCHIDEHRGQVSSDCQKCHDYEGWKKAAKFDHAKTDFALVGRHALVTCDKCHATIVDNRSPEDLDFLKFAGIKHGECLDCHKLYHKSDFDKDCRKCHSPTGWRDINRKGFTHENTRFPLKGKHTTVKCDKCHEEGKPFHGLKFARCVDCHSDYHLGQFASRQSQGECGECHIVEGFSPARFGIEEHSKTDYPLSGSHLAIPCTACHKVAELADGKSGPRFVFSSTRCIDCHKDPHKGQVDKYVSADGCEHCHVVEGWAKVVFDHDSTGFKLEARHKTAACRACHKPETSGSKSELTKFRGLQGTCSVCHKDNHRGQFAMATTSENKMETDCGRCHSPVDWKADRFDHNVKTAFKLEGAHRKTACAGCHKTITKNEISYVLYKPIDPACTNCHGENIELRRKELLDD